MNTSKICGLILLILTVLRLWGNVTRADLPYFVLNLVPLVIGAILLIKKDKVSKKSYLIIDEQIIDAKKYKEHLKVPESILKSFGGKYVLNSKNIETISDKWTPEKLVIIEFKNKNYIKNFLSSDEFAAIKQKGGKAVNTKAVIAE
ncbi:MAG TPA: DUF1330 domain-containing protein [Victivallales bacterium]|nr:DUF1330 domain-containing protein [Victivallales bacterium]